MVVPSPISIPTLGSLVLHAGPAVWLCLLLGAVGTALVIEGFLKFRPAALVPPDQFEELLRLIDAGAYAEAAAYCQEHRSFVCAVAGFGLRRHLAGRDTLPADLAEATLRQEARLRGPIAALSAIGVLAPMIGLTGTVLGMSGAFAVLARTGTGDFPSLSGAIGRVLLSTAAGLLVAIPGFVFTYYFKTRQERAALFARRALSRLFERLPALGRAGEVRRPREEEPEFGLQIAPLLDLLFVLLLFFMIVAGSRQQEGEIGLAFNRAATSAAAPETGEAARIDIDAEGQVFFNRVPCGNARDAALPALREKLRALDAAHLILITPQPRTRQDRIVAVLDACREANTRRIAFGAPGE